MLMVFMAERRIVLVDDDPIMRELAGSKLRSAGHTVLEAENGAEALSILEAGAGDLVISDLDMPVMDGFELTHAIRRHKDLSQTPVLVITGSDHEEAVERAFAAGATSFLAKPINWTLFSYAVKFVLRASEDEKALRAARDRAQAGEKFKDELLSVMSHELRTPLNAIIGFSQLLGDHFKKSNDPLHKEYADYIVDGGRRLLNSISDMLLASDSRAGPITLYEKTTTVDDVIKSACTIFEQNRGNQKDKREISINVREPDLEVCCDGQLIARAISKLVENAVKFSDADTPVIIAAAPTKNGELAIMVKDHGEGIAPEKLKEVSSPFAQSEMSSRRTNEGIGLGLPLVKTIVDAHDARFRLDSKLGEGSRAIVVIPRDRVMVAKSQPDKMTA